MMDKIMGAFTFRAGVYKEVEEDATFTPTAWMIVVVAALLNALGATAEVARVKNVGTWILSTAGTTIFAVLGFALACFVVDWVGRTFFQADVTFEEVVRTLGLASIWSAVGFLGIVAIFSRALACATGIFTIAAAIAGLIAGFIAIKEALDLEWPQTIGTVIIAWVIRWIVSAISLLILGGIGLTGAALFGAFN